MKRKEKITWFLQWNDKNGWYTDERCDLEEAKKMTYKEAVKYFFGVLNEEFYYKKVDNIFELTYEEVIKDAKENGFYESTCTKLKLLVENKNPTEEFYGSLI
ncbi:hypothetical protein [uncultured Clostridium sp.]|uniref:hypothetical protein n=1 Tax=uncultured Clostridium sp. TaxID=59620 RepID=UPI0026036D5B|nr:hypothetical protein [uncultured Clostridium sp.]